MRFFSFCVGNVDYEYVKDDLAAMTVSYTILEKVLSVFTSKLRDMHMTDKYIDAFTHMF